MTELATQDLARARAARIRAGIQTYLHTLADVSAAYAQRDWVALGYADWQAYVDGEYGAERLRLSPEHRAKAVAELRLSGMSQRAIGAALGVAQDTVRRDLAQLNDSVQTPERIVSLDGRERPAARPQTPATGPEPEPEASTSAGSGHDHPPRTGEADAPLDSDGSRGGAPSLSEAPAGLLPPAGAGDNPAHEEWPPVTQPAFAAALDAHAPDADAPHREWRRNFLAAVNGAYRPISRSTAQEVADRADDECVVELARVAAELTSFADQVRSIRAANLPKNVLSLVRRA